MESDTATTGWASLSLELRQTIWAFVYTTQDARVVEVRTATHAHYDQPHDWCPRSSPSPRPTIINTCHESRRIGHEMALRAGHLIFRGNLTQNTCSCTFTCTCTYDAYASDIYFNPNIDTLYVRNEKEYWIRDWGPEGILTQLWTLYHPDQLRFLAIEIEPLTRATTRWSLDVDLFHFPNIEEIMFVVKEDNEESQELLRILNRARQGVMRDGLEGYQRPRPKVSPLLGLFKLAVLRRGRFECLASPAPPVYRGRRGRASASSAG
ncbi:hypothetical protein IFR05_011711 [Cadophora sp. M221]|nr:hypothetical protein IFR05_011711 [Cadophora sp. M221]